MVTWSWYTDSDNYRSHSFSFIKVIFKLTIKNKRLFFIFLNISRRLRGSGIETTMTYARMQNGETDDSNTNSFRNPNF